MERIEVAKLLQKNSHLWHLGFPQNSWCKALHDGEKKKKLIPFLNRLLSRNTPWFICSKAGFLLRWQSWMGFYLFLIFFLMCSGVVFGFPCNSGWFLRWCSSPADQCLNKRTWQKPFKRIYFPKKDLIPLHDPQPISQFFCNPPDKSTTLFFHGTSQLFAPLCLRAAHGHPWIFLAGKTHFPKLGTDVNF